MVELLGGRAVTFIQGGLTGLGDVVHQQSTDGTPVVRAGDRPVPVRTDQKRSYTIRTSEPFLKMCARIPPGPSRARECRAFMHSPRVV